MKKASLEILRNLETKTIMLCRRNKGMIAPTSIRFVSFQEALSMCHVSTYRYCGKTFYSFYSESVYVFENGKPKNIHHLLRKLLRENVLSLRKDENDQYMRDRIIINNDM